MSAALSTLNYLTSSIEENAEVNRRLLAECSEEIARIVDVFLEAFHGGRKVLLFGNGGSSSDAQHVAGEFVGRFLLNRRALPAIALNADTAVMTCISNDYSYQDVFARQIEALASPGDIVVGISTSGNSENVLRGIQAGCDRQAVTIGFTGESGGKLKTAADLCLCVPSKVTAHIQESHILVWHVICGMVDKTLFG